MPPPNNGLIRRVLGWLSKNGSSGSGVVTPPKTHSAKKVAVRGERGVWVMGFRDFQDLLKKVVV